MYHASREQALAYGLKTAGLTNDVREVLSAAKAKGIEIPGLEFWPQINSHGFMGRPGWYFDRDEIANLKKLVENLTAGDAPAKTTRKRNGEQHAAR